jgi:hypothetical protein
MSTEQERAEFIDALELAYCDLFITWEELQAAVKKFDAERGASSALTPPGEGAQP